MSTKSKNTIWGVGGGGAGGQPARPTSPARRCSRASLPACQPAQPSQPAAAAAAGAAAELAKALEGRQFHWRFPRENPTCYQQGCPAAPAMACPWVTPHVSNESMSANAVFNRDCQRFFVSAAKSLLYKKCTCSKDRPIQQ